MSELAEWDGLCAIIGSPRGRPRKLTPSEREELRGSLGYTWALTQITGHLILIQDYAGYHTSGPLRTFYTALPDRLTVYQRPVYSPDLNPIEGLWLEVKEGATHLPYFPHFDDLVAKVDTTPTTLAGKPDRLTSLHGDYRYLIPIRCDWVV